MDKNMSSMILQFIRKKKRDNDLITALLLKHIHDKKIVKRKTRRPNNETFRHLGHENLIRDYFEPSPAVNSEKDFRSRFRMSRRLFDRIVEDVVKKDDFFEQKRDRAGKLGFSTYQKITAAIHQLANEMPRDFLSEYLRMHQQTAVKCLTNFCCAIVELYEKEFFRRPHEQDIQRLQEANSKRGFPGMIGSLDCIHWERKKCSKASHQGGESHGPTVVLEAVASYDLWIWHAFFGTPDYSLNDTNALEKPHLFDELMDGNAPPSAFSVNGNQYDMGYYLVDSIYPEHAAFVKTIHEPQDPKQEVFAKKQESARKDAERALGVLQARFKILKDPVRLWNKKSMKDVMKACIILHNMIVEDQRNDEEQAHVVDDSDNYARQSQNMSVLKSGRKLMNKNVYHELQADLIANN